MFDRQIQNFTQKPLTAIAKVLLNFLKPNHITIIGFIFGVLMCISIYFEFYLTSIFFLILNRLCDGLDGVMARISHPTNLGAYLDIVFDFIIYSGYVLAFGLQNSNNLILSNFLLFSFICTSSTFFAQSLLQSKTYFQKNRDNDFEIKKGFVYASGLIEGTETIIFMIICILFPKYFIYLGLIFFFMCMVTSIARVYTIYKYFEDIPNNKN